MIIPFILTISCVLAVFGDDAFKKDEYPKTDYLGISSYRAYTLETMGEIYTGAKLGETPCFTQDMCSSIAHSRCKEGVCQCEATHVPHTKHFRCLRIAKATNEPCEIDKQCPSGSICYRKICREGNGASITSTIPVNILVLLSILLAARALLL